MKRLTILLLFLIPTLAHSFGGVVTDPTSYTYYIEQIEQSMEQLKTMENQVKETTKVYDQVTSVDKRLMGNLNRAQKQLQKIKDMQDWTISDARKSLKYAKNALEEVGQIPEYQEEVTEGIDSVFGEEENKNNNWVSVEAEKKAMRQKSLKQAIVDSEVAQEIITVQLEELETLASATNTTDTLKDSTDVTNTILLSLLDGQREVIQQLSNISRNIALASYDGKDKENKKEREIPDLTNPQNGNGDSKPYGCSIFDDCFKKQSPEEIMADFKSKVEG